ncbi:TPA: site-specific DNA-methyltransferase [Neisseria subflava]
MSYQTDLIAKLREIFQIDRADLDFGIYRILNSRSKEIGDYLQNRLPAKIQAAFSTSSQTQTNSWQKELAEAEKTAAALGANPDNLPKIQELKDKITSAQKGSVTSEAVVYNHLLTFFSRYYEEGDFISQRRYKGDTYAVPYSGEEVLLHWANKDQYYTKSGENFSNYRFKLSDGREVFFRLTAADTAKDNRKDNDAARVFALAQERVIEKEDDNGDIYEEAVYPIREISDASGGKTLEICFEYTVASEGGKKAQKIANENTIATLQDLIGEDWKAVWQPAPTENKSNRTLLEKHLADYTAKNTADYFIHKDLGGFLRRELDFYIKNEVMDLDNIQDAPTFANIEGSLHQIQTLRAIAREIIDFLAQLEDFQKKLWLKKKFVAKSHWLITLNHIPKEMLETVFANAKQREAWKNLFVINDLPTSPDGNPASFAESNPYLTVDTSLFPAAFQTALLAALSNDHDLDEATDGLLIHSDNFQALNLLQARYRGQVKCIYIDPPYNTEKDRAEGRFLYKDSYPHSSWLTLINDRVSLGKTFLNHLGVFAVSIDDSENYHLRHILNQNFGLDNYLYELIWNLGTGTQAGHFTRAHEYIHFYAMNKQLLPNFSTTKDGIIQDRAVKKISKANPASKIIFPASMRFEGKNAKFSGTIGGSEQQIITGEMVFEDGKLKYDVEIEAGWAMKNQVLSWLEGKETFDTKGQKVKEFYFNSQGILWYIKERGTEHPPTVISNIANTKTGSSELENILGFQPFPFPKSSKLIGFFGKLISKNNDIILDYFAGSGTTAHAVINLNREDGGRRKYILVEQGEYFDTVLKPRVQKVVYAENWKDGKPEADKESSLHGVPQIVKVLNLESYEDTLNNLVLKDSGDLFDTLPETVREDYLLRYMLADQSRDSLLNTEVFRRPFNYQMDIATDSAGATERMDIDLVETFNYLLGLRVHAVKDRIEKDGYLAVEGTLPDGETALVLWRDCEKVGYEGLDALLPHLKINPQDSEYDTVYINGDHNIATVWENENGVSGRLKIRQIESEFMALMFGDAQ